MAEVTIQQAFDLAVQHQNAGRLPEAEQIYRQILSVQPRHSDAMQMLGVLAHEVGRNDIAVDLIRQALALDPSFGEAYSNLGNALLQLGQIDQAINAYRQAIALRPRYAQARANLGYAFICNGQFREAIAVCREAIALDPSVPESHNNLGNALTRSGDQEPAIAAYRDAIRLRPNYAEAHFNLGLALTESKRLAEAIAAYRQAIAFRPNYAEAYNNLGNVLKDDGQLDEAIAAYRQSIAVRPDFADAYNNLGNSLKDAGELDGAIAAYRQAVALAPDKSWIHSNLVYAHYFHSGFDEFAIADQLRQWSRQHAEPLRPLIQPHSNDRDPHRRLRIGYISPDLRQNVVGCNLLPLVRRHDHSPFEITIYADVAGPDPITKEFQERADRWRNIMDLSDEKVAAQIREDQIDILVDLSLHMAHNRLLVFARKPAPVQVTYLAYCGSSGMEAMDYRLSDPYLDPEGTDLSCYSEKTIRLPRTYWCYQPAGVTPEVSETPLLEKGFVTFGCLNNFAKVSAAALELWAKILAAVPNSMFILHASPGRHREALLQRLGGSGIDASRVRFKGSQSWQDYIGTYSQTDIALDPFPYGGGITTCDALWMGVPVVSLSGKTAVGRGGRSILSNLGLPGLVASTNEQYVQIATDLAHDAERMAKLRETMRGRMLASPLMNATEFARDVESAYRQVWRTWCESASAQH